MVRCDRQRQLFISLFWKELFNCKSEIVQLIIHNQMNNKKNLNQCLEHI